MKTDTHGKFEYRGYFYAKLKQIKFFPYQRFKYLLIQIPCYWSILPYAQNLYV